MLLKTMPDAHYLVKSELPHMIIQFHATTQNPNQKRPTHKKFIDILRSTMQHKTCLPRLSGQDVRVASVSNAENRGAEELATGSTEVNIVARIMMNTGL